MPVMAQDFVPISPKERSKQHRLIGSSIPCNLRISHSDMSIPVAGGSALIEAMHLLNWHRSSVERCQFLRRKTHLPP